MARLMWRDIWDLAGRTGDHREESSNALVLDRAPPPAVVADLRDQCHRRRARPIRAEDSARATPGHPSLPCGQWTALLGEGKPAAFSRPRDRQVRAARFPGRGVS